MFRLVRSGMLNLQFITFECNLLLERYTTNETPSGHSIIHSKWRVEIKFHYVRYDLKYILSLPCLSPVNVRYKTQWFSFLYRVCILKEFLQERAVYNYRKWTNQLIRQVIIVLYQLRSYLVICLIAYLVTS